MVNKRSFPCKIVCDAANSRLQGYYESDRHHQGRYYHGIKRNGIRLHCLHNTNYNETEIFIEGPDGEEHRVHCNFHDDLEGPWWGAISKFYNGLTTELKEHKRLLEERAKAYQEKLRLAEQERLKDLSDYWSNK